MRSPLGPPTSLVSPPCPLVPLPLLRRHEVAVIVVVSARVRGCWALASPAYTSVLPGTNEFLYAPPLPPRGRMYSPAGRRNRPRVRRKNRIRLMTRGVMKRNPKFGAFRARQAMHRVARELTCPALLLLLRLPFWAPGVDGGSVVLPERVVTMIFCR